MIAILDAGFLYALIDDDDVHRPEVTNALERYHGRIILPVLALTETAYLVKRNLGLNALATFAESLSNVAFELEIPLSADFLRSAQILRKYNDANIDFVDACIVAMAERLNVTKILTVDRRHFSIFRPTHCESFELLPEQL